ncbi:MAG: hypothetical protein ABUT39_15375 [Acidobacteriota bacterium]
MLPLTLVLLLAGASPAADIHKVDFRNFTYRPSCADFESSEANVPVQIAGGKLEGKPGSALEGIFFDVEEVIYGDLDGDGSDEAVVRTNCNTGGTGQFDEGFVYGMKDGKPVLLGRIPGGDRASGGVRCVRFESGALKVDRVGNDSGAARGVDFVDTETWKLQAGGLAEAGQPSRRRLATDRPAKPIRFAKGKSSGIVTGSLSGKASGVDEYSVGARAGQTMTVQLTSPEKNAAFEIMIDDYSVTCRATEWTGELPVDGQYRVYVLSTKGTASYKLDVAIR